MMRGVISAMMLGVASAGLATPPALPAGMAVGKLQELNLQQLEALYALLDDDGDGALTVHEMIDLFDGINNDALLIDDCNGNPAPHHWCVRNGIHTLAPHAETRTAFSDG